MTEHLQLETLPAAAGRIGVATLNAPRKLNALDLGMIQGLDAQLRRWQADPEVTLVVLRGAGGKAFCAGGDIREVARALNSPETGGLAFAERYFSSEYRLDHLIHTFGKPLLVWGDGIVMGGGLGLMAGADCRLVTPRTQLAMPEITIGIFPDVGAGWFLNRMPGRSGLYVGLTGARLNAADALFLGLADYCVAEDALDGLLATITGTAWSGSAQENLERLKALVHPLETPVGEDSRVRERFDRIQRQTDHPRTPALVEAIVAGAGDDPWLADNARRLTAGSPTSAFVIHEQLRRTRQMSLGQVFRLELDMMLQCCRGHDFPEGVRALLVDKDNAPAWRPARLDEVDAERVAGHFAPAFGGRPNPLADLP